MASFSDPFGISIVDDGAYALVSDSGNGCIRKVTLNNAFEVTAVQAYAMLNITRKVFSMHLLASFLFQYLISSFSQFAVISSLLFAS